MRRRATEAALALLALALAGCAATPGPTALDGGAARHAVPDAAARLAELEAERGDPSWPAGPALLRTTRADIYIGNLDARLAALAARSDAASVRERARLLAYRHRILGRVEDAETAFALVDGYLARVPEDAEARLIRARLHATFHRFEAAREDLSAADGQAGVERARAEIDLATGRGDRLQDMLAAGNVEDDDLFALALRGNLAVQRGDAAAAERWFRMAQARFSDVSPMTLAWLHVQQGIAWLRFGEIDRARRFFAAAHERLPPYYLAAEHLAETELLLGRPERARALYLDVVAQTGAPEFLAALAEAEDALGNDAAASEALERAHAGFDALLARHAAAFADHAAGFYLEQGDPQRALELARANLDGRGDVMAWLLLAETEAANGHRRAACRALRHAAATGFRPPELESLAETMPRCVRRPARSASASAVD